MEKFYSYGFTYVIKTETWHGILTTLTPWNKHIPKWKTNRDRYAYIQWHIGHWGWHSRQISADCQFSVFCYRGDFCNGLRQACRWDFVLLFTLRGIFNKPCGGGLFECWGPFFKELRLVTVWHHFCRIEMANQFGRWEVYIAFNHVQRNLGFPCYFSKQGRFRCPWRPLQ